MWLLFQLAGGQKYAKPLLIAWERGGQKVDKGCGTGKNVLFLGNLKSKLVMPRKTGGLWLILLLMSFPVRAADYFKWLPVSSAFDSIASQVEYGFIHHAGQEQRKTWIKMLDSLSACRKGEAGRVMQWRSLYWKARTLLIGGDRMASDSVLSEALALVDSLHWPYDYMRMLHLEASLRKESLPDTYIALKGIEDFYRQARDSFMLAHACIDIGTVLTEIGDYGKAFGYMQEAGDIYRDLGETVYETKNRLNVANLLYLNGNYETSASMLKQLLEDSVCKEDAGFLIRVLLLLSEEGGDPDSMYAARAYGLARRYQASAFEKYAAVYLGDWYKDAGASDSALRMYCHAGEIDVRIPDALELLRLRHLAEVYGALGRDKEALRCWIRYAALKDTVDEEDNLLKIHQAEWRSVIARYEMDLLYSQERAAYKMKLSWMIWGGLILFLLALCYVFWKNRQEEKAKKKLKEIENAELGHRLENEALQKKYLEVELASRERELTSSQLILAEHKNELQSVENLLRKEAAQGGVNEGAFAALDGLLKQYLGKKDEWALFRVQFEKVHPAFFQKLKQHCPDLTEGELRLCAYLSLGMESKQIARMLSLQPDSIKKSRYRLRQKLRLETKDSIEDFLRRFL